MLRKASRKFSTFRDRNAGQTAHRFSLNSHAGALQGLCFVGTVALTPPAAEGPVH